MGGINILDVNIYPLNARVGKTNDVDNVIGMFGKASCNNNGNMLIELLQNCNLMICNWRTMLNDP